MNSFFININFYYNIFFDILNQIYFKLLLDRLDFQLITKFCVLYEFAFIYYPALCRLISQ